MPGVSDNCGTAGGSATQLHLHANYVDNTCQSGDVYMRSTQHSSLEWPLSDLLEGHLNGMGSNGDVLSDAGIASDVYAMTDYDCARVRQVTARCGAAMRYPGVTPAHLAVEICDMAHSLLTTFRIPALSNICNITMLPCTTWLESNAIVRRLAVWTESNSFVERQLLAVARATYPSSGRSA